MSELSKENKYIDYIGFTFNGKHSSQLGIVRTSDGSRFNENLLPTMQDKTIQVPGGDGTYYFGSYFTQKQFSVSFAYDNLTEQQISDIKNLFGDKKIHELVFDELPYKIYYAKVTGTATIKYIPFSEGETNRIYKGEGVVQFTCYQPYATCKKKWLDQYNQANKKEWKNASKMKDTQGTYDKHLPESNIINLWNAGDIESHFQFTINFIGNKIPNGSFYISGKPSYQLKWSEITKKGNDAYIKFNTKLNLIEGYDKNNIKTGNVYNQYIISGSFFKIPTGESQFIFDNSIALNINNEPIEYFYYYF